MMTPWCRRAITWAARNEQRNTPLRLTASTRSHQASSASRKWRSTLIKPALLTSTSTVPKRSSTSSNKRSTCSLLDTSAAPGAADPPLLMICWTVASAPAALTSLTITCAPSLPNRRAIARPMPCAAPVTSTIVLEKRCCISALSFLSELLRLSVLSKPPKQGGSVKNQKHQKKQKY